MNPVKNRPDCIAERITRTMKKYILLTTNHDSLNFLTFLSNGSLNRFPFKNPRVFLMWTLYEKTAIGSNSKSCDIHPIPMRNDLSGWTQPSGSPWIRIGYAYRLSIHLMNSMSLTFTRYRWVTAKLACLKITVETISTGTPDRLAWVAAYRRKSCGRNLIPTWLPAFLTTDLAAS